MNKATFLLLLLAIGLTLPIAELRLNLSVSSANESIPAPEDVLGFKPGDDRKLASWNQVLEYFEKLDRSSDRLIFEELGKSTMDKPFVMATISSPDNLARLEEYKNIQAQLADPRKLGPPRVRDRKAAELIRRGKTIVLITCGIHSTEVGSYLSSTLIAHRLASSNEPEIQNILQNTIILLVPSLNPDGVDIVKNWYDKTLGTPYEGTDPPELYHKYVGHDNNRDWYAFTQVETRITVEKIHNVWHPQIVHDIHQQGAFGSRMFLPPYMQPIEPNVPKQITEGFTELGNWMAGEMRAKGFKGITTNSTYDAWSPSRAYSHYHGGVRMLSETASARIATPITLKFEELTSRDGYDPKKESENFGPVWRGGEWKLRDITNHMTTAAFLLLRHASEHRERWLKRFYEIGKQAVRPWVPGKRFGFLIPPTANSDALVKMLTTAGVEVSVPIFGPNSRIEGSSVADGTRLVRIDQPYGSFANALLERQQYPNLRDSSGQPVTPYDATAHTLPLLLGVHVRELRSPLKYRERTVLFSNSPNCCGLIPGARLHAIYQSSMPSMDEGWTRWIFHSKGISHGVLTETDLRAGKMTYGNAPYREETYRAIVFPDQSSNSILNGYPAGSMPPDLTGGLGQTGIQALRKYVEEDGGTLVFLNRASEFIIEQFKLPIRNVVAGLPRTDFYVPGSILRIELDPTHPISQSLPKQTIAWAEQSPVFEVIEDPATANEHSVPASAVKVIAWYPREGELLLSGWLLGGEKIRGKAALVEVTMGKGKIVLFGFRPQYRAQSLATYPLLFNSLR